MDAQSVGYFAALGGIALFDIWKVLRPLHVFRSPRKFKMRQLSLLIGKCYYIIYFLSFFFFFLSLMSLLIHWSHPVTHTHLAVLLWTRDQQHTSLTTNIRSPGGIRPATPASERPQTHALACAATGICGPLHKSDDVMRNLGNLFGFACLLDIRFN